MKEEFSASFPAEIAYLHTIMEWMRNRIEEYGFQSFEAKKIEIAIEEAIVNIIHYAYPDKKGMIELICHFQGKEGMEISIKDQGIPFNPLEHIRPIDPNISLEERKIGGLGLSLISEIMDEMHYQRQGNTNILKLKKQTL